jgi:Flp pilus assembly pilin Flp
MTYLQKARARLAGSQLIRDEAGLSTVEYVIILVLIAAVAMATWQQFGSKLNSALGGASTQFDNTVGTAASQTGGGTPTPP